MAYWQLGLSPELWADLFYTTFTTVRSAVLNPIIMLVVFLMLRLAGQRGLTEQTLFNRLTLVALGSLVASSALRPNTPLVAVVIATAVIIGFTVAVNNAYARGWISGNVLRPLPMLLWVDGQFITENMRHCQMTQDKFDSELRQKGYVSLAKVFAVTLEPPGKFAIVTKGAIQESDDWALLEGLRGYDEHLKQLKKAERGDLAPGGSMAC